MLQASRHHTADLAAADVVLVNDYCLMTSIIAMYHSGAYSDGWEPLAQLGLAYKIIAKSARSVQTKAPDITVLLHTWLKEVTRIEAFLLCMST